MKKLVTPCASSASATTAAARLGRKSTGLRKHLDYRPGSNSFSVIRAPFFDAVQQTGIKLPLVKGELQHHAVGCYSVVHRIKQEVRQTEDLLTQAENMVKTYPRLLPAGTRNTLDSAWQHLLFNQFHDILAGSSIRNAYAHAYDELGTARTTVRQLLVRVTRQLQGTAKALPGATTALRQYLGSALSWLCGF